MNGPPQTDKQKLQALRALSEAAKTAGADEAAKVLANNARAVERAAQDNKPLGARLDSARARLAKAKKSFANAQANVKQALQRQADAELEQEDAEEALQDLEQEVRSAAAHKREEKPATTPTSQNFVDLVAGVKGLLATLESGWGTEDLSEAVRNLSTVVARVGPETVATCSSDEHMDTPDEFEPRRAGREARRARTTKKSDAGRRSASRTPPRTGKRAPKEEDADDELPTFSS